MALLAGCTLIAPLGGLSDALEGEGGPAGNPAQGSDGAPADAFLAADQGVVGPGEEAGPVPEGGSTSDAGGCTTLCACQNDTECPKGGVCANSLTVTPALYAAAGGASFCTLACCSSADCPAGTVCFASGAGGQYCVAPSWIGRSAPGTALGGAACSSDGACRSGLCASGQCADTCCSLASSSSQCAAGVCAFGAFPGRSFDTHFAPHCQAQTGSLGFGASCSSSSQCRGGLCYQSGGGGNCTNPCETSAECGPGNGCQFDQQGQDVYVACFPTPGSKADGLACTMDSQCAGYWCNSSSECTGACFRNSDCTVSGWYCRTEADTVPTGTYDVLVCGP
ncbi:MAG TPA: hypothetical protein VF765_15025 [Polyangiaceae bacterium]